MTYIREIVFFGKNYHKSFCNLIALLDRSVILPGDVLRVYRVDSSTNLPVCQIGPDLLIGAGFPSVSFMIVLELIAFMRVHRFDGMNQPFLLELCRMGVDKPLRTQPASDVASAISINSPEWGGWLLKQNLDCMHIFFIDCDIAENVKELANFLSAFDVGCVYRLSIYSVDYLTFELKKKIGKSFIVNIVNGVLHIEKFCGDIMNHIVSAGYPLNNH